MDSWPANDRNDHITTTGRKTKPKRKVKDVFPNYPDIVQGSLNAATLTQGGGGLQWLSAVKSSGQFTTPYTVLSTHNTFNRWKPKYSFARGKAHNDVPYNSSPDSPHPEDNCTAACGTGSEHIVPPNPSIDTNLTS